MYAQDTRHITEPHIPAPCATLEARTVANHGVIASPDQRTLDTERIQQAIDACAPRKAVVLRGQGKKNVFLSGPFVCFVPA